jgi:hypothetical protein
MYTESNVLHFVVAEGVMCHVSSSFGSLVERNLAEDRAKTSSSQTLLRIDPVFEFRRLIDLVFSFHFAPHFELVFQQREDIAATPTPNIEHPTFDTVYRSVPYFIALLAVSC